MILRTPNNQTPTRVHDEPSSIDTVEEQLREQFRARTSRSAALYARALGSLPGGNTRTSTFFRPYPLFVERAEGCRLHDVDGNTYLDLLNNFTSLIHGHGHPRITAAIAAQAAKGTVYAAPAEVQLALAEEITRRVASIQRVRFTNSGTEAVMNALRVARAFTGRSKFLKMEGGYHGSYDPVEISIAPGPDGPVWPAGEPDEIGLSPALKDEVLVAPFNDLETTLELIEQHHEDLAAVVVEPVMAAGGMIPANQRFLEGLRAATTAHRVLLILDEIISFRLAPGGAQQLYRIEPDLTTLGKIIGGGLPIGAFGGRADIMELFDPRRSDRMTHAGTFNGSPVCMAAGLPSLELLTPAEIDRINGLGDPLRDGFKAAFAATGVPGCVTGYGSLVQTHLVDGEVHNYRDGARAPAWYRRVTHLALLTRGVFSGWRTSFNVSTAMGEAETDEAIATFHAVLEELAAHLPE
ncbi:MAG: aspartate aminotransferase family protein [Acidobacteriota bacterium]|nr:aspartate aminotransferase family protein [Acidobacteriota bacterium]